VRWAKEEGSAQLFDETLQDVLTAEERKKDKTKNNLIWNSESHHSP
jgi:hypothetical protein